MIMPLSDMLIGPYGQPRTGYSICLEWCFCDRIFRHEVHGKLLLGGGILGTRRSIGQASNFTKFYLNVYPAPNVIKRYYSRFQEAIRNLVKLNNACPPKNDIRQTKR